MAFHGWLQIVIFLAAVLLFALLATLMVYLVKAVVRPEKF